MNDKIVITKNMAAFVSLASRLEAKPARQDRMGLIFGRWGTGKTTTLEWFYTHNLCFHVRAMAAWCRSVTMMVEDFLRAYRVEARGRFRTDIRELVRVAKRYGCPLFIDEADRVVRKAILIETIRDLHDLARIPIILIGQEHIINMLQRRDLGQVFSRITEIYEFKGLSIQDIQKVTSELYELQADEKVASFIKTATIGDFRLTNALLTRAESFCLLNKTREITLSMAKKAATAMPDQEALDRLRERQDIPDAALESATG